MKSSFTLLIVAVFQITLAEAASLKLTQDIYTRYLKYSFQPKSRNVFKSASLGVHEKFKERTLENLRRRMTPMLPRLKTVYDLAVQDKVPLTNYNPLLPQVFIQQENLSKLGEVKFPANLRWITDNTNKLGKEFIEISLTQKPSAERFKLLMINIERLLKLNLKRTVMRDKKGKRLSKREQEMLEPIKEKTLVLTKYQQYYGIHYKFSGFVEANYYPQLEEQLKSHFTKIQTEIKYHFNRSKQINLAINAKIIYNLEKEIEDKEFKSLEEPFELPEPKLDKVFYRFKKDTEISEVHFLIAKKPDSDSVLPVLNKLFDKI